MFVRLAKRTNKMWYLHVAEYYSASERTEILIQVSEISQTQKDKYFRFHLHKVHGIVKLIETSSRMVFARSWGKREWRVIV